MFQNPEMNEQLEQFQNSKLPFAGAREAIPVTEGAELNELANWISDSLDELVQRCQEFESPASNRKFYSR